MKTLNICLLALLCFTTAASAVEITSRQFISFNTNKSRSKVPTTLSSVAREFSVNVPAMAATFKSSYPSITLTEFPISKTETATLQLVPAHSVIDARSKCHFGTKIGTLPDVVAYRGVIVGEPNSKVLLNYAEGDLIGSVTRETGEKFTVSPFGNSKTDSREHTVAPTLTVLQQMGTPAFNCATDESGPILNSPSSASSKDKSGSQILSTKPLEVEVIVESTSGFFTGPGRRDEAKAAAYIVALYNMVSLIYEDEMNITYHIKDMQIWTDKESDDYKNSGVKDGDNSALLEEFVARWKGSPERDLMNLLSTPGATQVLGKANGIGFICVKTGNSTSHAVCGISGFRSDLPTFTYSEEVVTIAHENGHVFGAAHTHNCEFWKPALDSCMTNSGDTKSQFYSLETCNSLAQRYNTGSIMSYCHLFNRGVAETFLPKVYKFLRQNMETKLCLTEPATTIIKVQRPVGNQSFKAGTDTVVRWTASSSIQNVKIEFSSDGGATWSVIPGGQSVNSQLGARDYGQGTIAWKVPFVSTTQGLIRVSDADNPSTSSTTLAPFTIQSASLTIQYPMGGERFGQKEKFDVQWAASLVSAVKVEFSSDNGATWTTLTPNAVGSYSYDVPDIETSRALIRISDASNNKLVSESGVFSIGKEKIALRTPNGGDIVCANKDFVINWSTDFISASSSRVRFQYSIDNGVTWTYIGSSVGVDARAGTYTWSGTKPVSATAKFKIVYKNDTTITAISEKAFTIDGSSNCVPLGVDEPKQGNQFATLSVSPNPISSQGTATVEFPSPCARIECTLVDTKGAIVAALGTYDNLTAGEHELRFDVANIPSGAYFLTLSCGGQRISAPLTILR